MRVPSLSHVPYVEPKEQHPEQKQEQPVHQSAQKEQQPIHEESEYRVEAVIQGVSGLLNGKTYMLTAGTPLIFGRRTEKCNVLFKNETKGISSLHCEIKWYNGKVLIKDLGSGRWTGCSCSCSFFFCLFAAASLYSALLSAL